MEDNFLIIGFILFFVVASIFITWWTSRTNSSAADFYVAGKGVPWIQVGIAMVGSYLSAASFLGCAGDIGVFGIDSIWISIGFFGGYMSLLFLIAGPLRNVGSFTVAGALHRRYPDNKIKFAITVCTIVVSTFYLVPQMIGAGALFTMLLGWDFLWVTIGIGTLVSTYIIFGGMKSTLYNQVLQALFLWATMIAIIILSYFTIGDGFLDALNTAARAVPPLLSGKNPAVVEALSSMTNADSMQAIEVTRQLMPDAPSVMTLGVKTGSSLAMISMVIALIFGTAGLPHILVMFFTVPNARAAKKSVAFCISALAIFYLAAIILGFLLFPAIYPKLVSWISQGPTGVGMAKNMAVLEIGMLVGGKWLVAIAAAGAVAAVLSTSAGLMITVASAFSNDIYKVYVNPNATDKQGIRVARITTIVMSVTAVTFATVLRDENVAWLVTLGFGIAASAIFPAMLGTLWWRRATRQGVITSVWVGLSVSMFFIVLLLTDVKSFIGLPTGGGPGIFGVGAAFLTLWLVSINTRDTGENADEFLTLAHAPDTD
ncbi:MAG: cation acetate symporter [Alphaproteobacteria bacterium]|nr:cation acetate symporter [Alphaproteobacteria bacterium]